MYQRIKLTLFLFLIIFHSYTLSFGMQDAEVDSNRIRNPLSIRQESKISIGSFNGVNKISEENKGDWRQHWFIQNVIVEMPVIGDFFNESDMHKAFKRASKSTFMLVGGSLGMMFNFVDESMNDNMITKLTKTTINMAIGMGAAGIFYNICLYGGSYCCKNVPEFLFPSQHLESTELLKEGLVRSS